MSDRISIIRALTQQLRARSYLEIGVQHGECFDQIQVARKVGVDPDKLSSATHHTSSDAFFAALPPDERFDVVFIDGLHLREQVLRDVANARAHLTPGGVIVLHDCLPPSEAAGGRAVCGGPWCGDVWRAWLELRSHVQDRLMAVVEDDFGVGVILPGLPIAHRLDPRCAEANWSEFQQHHASWLPLISSVEFDRICARLPPLVRER